jgi:hypothetical protein
MGPSPERYPNFHLLSRPLDKDSLCSACKSNHTALLVHLVFVTWLYAVLSHLLVYQVKAGFTIHLRTSFVAITVDLCSLLGHKTNLLPVIKWVNQP